MNNSLHCHGPSSRTHKSGNHHDLIAGINHILENTIATRFLHEDDCASLDHSRVFLDLTNTILEKNKDPASLATRVFTSHHKNKVPTFNTTMDLQLCNNLLLNNLLEF